MPPLCLLVNRYYDAVAAEHGSVDGAYDFIMDSHQLPRLKWRLWHLSVVGKS
jgi:hypothetical protein